MSRLTRLGMAVGLGALAATLGYVVDATGAEEDALGPGVVRVEVGIEHSRFDLEALRVQEGPLVEFVVDNGDPIDHELVVGDDAATPTAPSAATRPCPER